MSDGRKPYTFYIESDLADGLKQIKERDGISESEQIRRAIRQWLDGKGLAKEGKRPARRKRS
jgi:ribbon-helix-helix CopG family protein